jgi:four helix bundle protein
MLRQENKIATHKFKELIVWQKARTLVKEVYELVGSFPDEEKFGLNSQIKRAVISVPSNIAEGAGRGSNKEFSRFLKISNGSIYELETLFILAQDLKLVEQGEFYRINSLMDEIQRMIYTFILKLNSDV